MDKVLERAREGRKTGSIHRALGEVCDLAFGGGRDRREADRLETQFGGGTNGIYGCIELGMGRETEETRMTLRFWCQALVDNGAIY